MTIINNHQGTQDIVNENNETIVSNIRATRLEVIGNIIIVYFAQFRAAYNLQGVELLSFDLKSSSAHTDGTLLAYKLNRRNWAVVSYENVEILPLSFQKVVFFQNRIFVKKNGHMEVYTYNGVRLNRIKAKNFDIKGSTIRLVQTINNKDVATRYDIESNSLKNTINCNNGEIGIENCYWLDNVYFYYRPDTGIAIFNKETNEQQFENYNFPVQEQFTSFYESTNNGYTLVTKDRETGDHIQRSFNSQMEEIQNG